ncbi:MAG: 30S ribosomal protein S4 [Spirochaetia bacterium]|jgi:small subunit ribosomal protein S4|nr:30S ribosomal protein S4 [Spirochaetia bacterium]
MTGHDMPRGKIVRRLGINIFGNEKYDRLLKKKPHSPGKNPKSSKRGKISDYSQQLLEKQKLKYTYGLSEPQMRNLFKKAASAKGKTGDTMVKLLEQRLDNIIYVSGFARTRGQARQMVTHGNFRVNDKSVDIPSYRISLNDRITLGTGKKASKLIRANLAAKAAIVPPWIKTDTEELTLLIQGYPDINEENSVVKMHLVVEYFAR